jgi:stress response protein YsnF
MSGDDGVLKAAAVALPPSDERIEAGETSVIPVVEETARIEKRAVEKGRVRVSTHTDTVEQVLRETLRGEAVGVTRVPVDRVIAEGEAAPQVRDEGGVTIIPVLEEVLVIEKRLVLKEEVHIRRTASGEAVEVPVRLRKQRAVVESVSADGHVSEVPPQEKTS